MTDELDILRSFRADVTGPDTDTMARIRTAVAERTTAAGGPRTAGTPDDAITSGEAPDLIYVLPSDGSSRCRRPWPALVAAAAALLILAGIVTWSTQGDDPSDGGIADTTGSLAPLGLDPAPDGYVLRQVVPPSAEPAPDEDRTGTWTFYGPDAPDDAPPHGIAVGRAGAVEDGFGLDERDDPDATRVEVGDGIGLLHLSDGEPVLEVERDGELYALMGRNVDTQTLLEAAATVSIDDGRRAVLDVSRLPNGWREHGHVAPARSRGTVVYAGGGAAADPLVVISWEPGGAERLELMRFLVDETAGDCAPCPAVDGHPTVAGSSAFAEAQGADVVAYLSWAAGGRVVSITGHGTTLGDLYTVAASLAETTWDELEAAMVPFDSDDGSQPQEP
ncbi:hypothetical protein [Actinomarinicola tropica]|uniref:Uncharacterized protein n=1 Tax=Actinomarinicola tropica TaxID=2789776 RepID=A0A5Q2RPD7_9ACTN|nr:hypothetical protein [Actinomarinicola tropica]QGG96812.1 hypothetical protein GH723_17860 [Actinomarinicola tropica]